jgi:RES domain-containing protein
MARRVAVVHLGDVASFSTDRHADVSAVPLARARGRTHRLIASRWPVVGIFERVATPDDARDALVLESWTNDRITAELDRLMQLPDDDWVIGRPGATLVMAAFCHSAPGGGRFNTERLGAWYAAREIETAIAETVHHHRRRLALSELGFHCTIQMRELRAMVDARFHDIRGQRESRPDLYDADSYARSQPFGERLRAAGSNGILFDSVRRTGGHNMVVFRPRLLPPIYEGDRYDYRWTGEPEPAVIRLAETKSRS